MVQALTRIITGHRPTRPSGDHEMRQGLWATVKACWRHTPSTRPSAYKVLEFLGLYLQDPKILPNFPPSIDSAECSIMDAVAVPASCEPPAANCPVMLSSQHAAKPDDEEPNSPPPASDCDTRPAEAESEALAVNHNE